MGYGAQQLNRKRCETRPGPVQAPHVPTLAEKVARGEAAELRVNLLELDNNRLHSELEQATKALGEATADNEGLRAALKVARSDLAAAQALVEEAGRAKQQQGGRAR